ncbi:MAG: PEGA domain-containing protein [Bacteroidota bacterium]
MDRRMTGFAWSVRMAVLTALVAASAALPGLAQELAKLRLVDKGEMLPGELVASSVRDANGRVCAGLVVVTDLEGLSYQANNGVVRDTLLAGDKLLYLQPEERVVTIWKTGYERLRIILNDEGIRLESGRVWQIRVTGERKAERVSVTIQCTPPDARVSVAGRSVDASGPVVLPEGRYPVRVEKEGYRSRVDTIAVSPTSNFFRFTLPMLEQSTVEISSVPPGARILWENAQRGETPDVVYVYPGRYGLKLTRDGYLDADTVLDVQEGKKTRVSVVLRQNTGRLILSVRPQGARVYLDREEVSPAAPIQRAPGTYRLDVQCAGYRDTTEVITIRRGEDLSRSVELMPRTGRLRVKVRPPEANVRLLREGAEVRAWEGADIVGNLLVGTYELECSLKNHETDRRQITIQEGRTLDEEVYLAVLPDVVGPSRVPAGPGQARGEESVFFRALSVAVAGTDETRAYNNGWAFNGGAQKADFLSAAYRRSRADGMLKDRVGFELGVRGVVLPLVFHGTYFQQSYDLTPTTGNVQTVYLRGMNLSLGAAVLPLFKYLIPEAGAGYQVSSLAITGSGSNEGAANEANVSSPFLYAGGVVNLGSEFSVGGDFRKSFWGPAGREWTQWRAYIGYRKVSP